MLNNGVCAYVEIRFCVRAILQAHRHRSFPQNVPHVLYGRTLRLKQTHDRGRIRDEQEESSQEQHENDDSNGNRV